MSPMVYQTALGRIPADEAIRAIQRINVDVYHWTFMVTAAGNAPLNNALAAIDADTVDATREWARYTIPWTRWNHVRTVASLVAAGLFTLALDAM